MGISFDLFLLTFKNNFFHDGFRTKIQKLPSKTVRNVVAQLENRGIEFEGNAFPGPVRGVQTGCSWGSALLSVAEQTGKAVEERAAGNREHVQGRVHSPVRRLQERPRRDRGIPDKGVRC